MAWIAWNARPVTPAGRPSVMAAMTTGGVAQSLDSMLKVKTEGLWQETRDYYRFDKPTLGINARQKVSVIVPGCQVVFTELEPGGKPLPQSDKKVFRGPGPGHGIVTPISPQTTCPEVRPCQECHADPKTLGIGQGWFKVGERWKEKHLPWLKPEINPLGFAWESLTDPRGGLWHPQLTRGARPFNAEELKRLLRVAPCLPCHGRYDDPIWAKPADAFARAKLPTHQQKVGRRLNGTGNAGSGSLSRSISLCLWVGVACAAPQPGPERACAQQGLISCPPDFTQPAYACGRCHEEQNHWVKRSLMATASGIINYFMALGSPGGCRAAICGGGHRGAETPAHFRRLGRSGGRPAPPPLPALPSRGFRPYPLGRTTR